MVCPPILVAKVMSKNLVAKVVSKKLQPFNCLYIDDNTIMQDEEPFS